MSITSILKYYLFLFLGLIEFNSVNCKQPINLRYSYLDSAVTYSLNKKKRWLLPNKIESVMKSQIIEKDELEPDLTVVKRMPPATHESCANRCVPLLCVQLKQFLLSVNIEAYKIDLTRPMLLAVK